MSDSVDEHNLALFGPEHKFEVGGGLPEAALVGAAKAIRAAISRSVKELVFAGLLLSDVKNSLPHGHWEAWIESEFTFSIRHANRLINAALGITQIIPFEDTSE